ncbi:sterile alpha motif domain-containing protein 9-like [Mugil cephalus]|uniref:sterile alpha motif domain-containing protein 9-like n=1 Tax=Mugil cephalus TaxID=48193 RepID=UPI001FB66A39|nr:sterile alpha motif domain-containing protein 9-like [Mugil cephalus]
MEHNSTQTVTPDDSVVNVEEESRMEFNSCKETLKQYIKDHRQAPNTKLFSFLALLNAYVPDSYITMDECQRILGPPDPIHGGPPFEERMKPFTVFIKMSGPLPGRVCMIHPEIAKSAVELLADLNISRGRTARQFFRSFCNNETEDMVQFIKDLLTKREMGEHGKAKFSSLILDICENQDFHQALSVLEMASDTFGQNPNFPQTIARLYYLESGDYNKTEEWAQEAIRRAPNNSYVADTLGQIHKNNLLRRVSDQRDVEEIAEKAYSAFKDVEEKAEREEGPEMEGTPGVVSTSDSFNNRGLFGFIQVAKIVFKKLGKTRAAASYPNLQKEVEDKFDFFEWYLTYSKPDMKTFEPDYFWRDVALCYEYYTGKTAAESTSFPGLLNCLDRGLFSSKGSRARFQETENDLQQIRDELKTMYETNVDDVKVAERYILSNIVLSNKEPDSASLSPVQELQTVIHKFLCEVGCRSPEFYLLVLLLFWPEEPVEVKQEEDVEVKQEPELEATEEDGSQDKTWEDVNTDEDQDTGGEAAQPSPDLMSDPDLQDIVTLMKEEFARAKYAKYLRGRYLLPLFFLGKGSGLSRWIHKSKLDVVVETMVLDKLEAQTDEEDEREQLKKELDTQTDEEESQQQKKKMRLFHDMWIKGEVWQNSQIKEMLLPVQVEPCNSSMTLEEQEEVFVLAGGKKIKARVEDEADERPLSTMLYYLGFTIQGPVVFRVGAPHSEQ